MIGAGLALKARLTGVRENALEYAAACAILSFGTGWSLGGIVGERAAWPLGDGTLLLLFAADAVAGRIMAWAARVPSAGRALGIGARGSSCCSSSSGTCERDLRGGRTACRGRALQDGPGGGGALLVLILIGAAAVRAF